MKKIIVTGLLLLSITIVGCGKAAKESGSSGSNEANTTPPEYVFFSSTTNPHISMVRFGYNLINEDIVIETTATVNINNYQIQVVSGNSFLFTTVRGDTMVYPNRQTKLVTGLPTLGFMGAPYSGGMFGWGATTSEWTRGSIIKLVTNTGNVLQTIQL